MDVVPTYRNIFKQRVVFLPLRILFWFFFEVLKSRLKPDTNEFKKVWMSRQFFPPSNPIQPTSKLIAENKLAMVRWTSFLQVNCSYGLVQYQIFWSHFFKIGLDRIRQLQLSFFLFHHSIGMTNEMKYWWNTYDICSNASVENSC